MATFPPRPLGRGLQVDIKGVLADEDQLPTMSEPTHIENEKEIVKSFIKEKIKEGIYPSVEKPKLKKRPRF